MVQGNPDNKHRYIFTKIDNVPRYLIMSKCNLCPFLIDDFEKGEAKCGKFANTKSSWEDVNYITKVYGYIQKKRGSTDMRILTAIDIPFWCGLPTHIASISSNDAINYIKDGKLQVESGQNYANTIQIIDEDEVIVSDDDGESLHLKPKDNKYIKYDNGSKKSSYKPDKIEKTCSLCGEEKKNVNRDEHLGMCSRCWDKFKFSHPRRYTAKINNFRLKRKETWKKKEYKKVSV